MKNRSFVVAAMLIGALALVATGCGSKKGKYSASKADYAAALNSICATINKKQAAINLTTISDLSGQKGTDLQAAVEAALSSVDKLGTPPEEIKAAVDDFVSLKKASLDRLKQAIEAVNANDVAKATSLAQAGSADDAKTDADANTIGAPACLSTAS